MPTIFTYQALGCVMIMPRYVPEVVTSPEVIIAAGGKHTQYFDTPELELAAYGTLQVATLKAPPPQNSNLSVTQVGNEVISKLVPVSVAAFGLALREQDAVAVGINLNATTPLPQPDATTLLRGLLNAEVAERDLGSKTTLIGGGVKLIYDRKPWVATVTIEIDPKNAAQVACAVNFNIDKPTKGQVTLVQQADKLREWFERTTWEIVGEGVDA